MFGFRAMPNFVRAATQARSTKCCRSFGNFVPKYYFSQVQLEVQMMAGNCTTTSPSNLVIANLR